MSTNNAPTGQRSSLPTFTPIHALPNGHVSNAGSTKASSSRSGSRSQARSNHEDDTRQDTTPDTREEIQKVDGGISQGIGTVKRQKRLSGGFLLDSSPTSSRLSRSLLLRKSIKGKEKSEDSPLVVPKTRNQFDGQGSSSSVRASIQSTDVRFSLSDQRPKENSIHSSNHNLNPSAHDGSQHSHRSSDKGQALPTFGFDTDPAQIVDMALRLNEGRKRQASAKRFVSSGTRGRRVISDASLPSNLSPPNKTHLNGSLNATSRQKALSAEPITPQQANRVAAGRTMGTSPLVQDGFSPEHDGDEIDQDMQVSRATQNRVAKAKAYFELAYEHRRLLSHLPPIRSPVVPYPPDKPGYDSKAYNPLQYARNRKLRFRERHPIDSEAEGWYDIEKVRAWVDAVVKSTPTTHHDPVQCIRLPPLTLLEEDSKEPSDSEENADATAKNRHKKVRRPKSDWVTHPGDLVADAFWTEQGLNKKKIYNRDNEPVYPPGTTFMFSGWRNRTPVEVPEELKMSSSSPDQSPIQNKKLIDSPPELPAFESAHKDHTWAKARSKFGKTLRKNKRVKKDRKDKDIFNTSDDSSASEDSVEGSKDRRGRKRTIKGHDKLALPEGEAFDRQGQTIGNDSAVRSSSDFDPDSPYNGRQSMDRAHLLRYLRRSSTGITEDDEKPKLGKRRRFLESIKLDPDHAARSSFEYDSTAPGTPVAFGFPSIAINLSPPESRSPSPERKNSNSFLGVVKDRALSTINSREYRDTKNHIDGTDFAQPVSHSTSRTRNSHSHHRESSRTASPMTRGISPGDWRRKSSSVDGNALPPPEHHSHAVSKVNSRATDQSHRSHRVRGMFKGGRIAELVGHEVNRAHDFIWKRDPPRRNITDGGSVSGYETESDDFSDYMVEKPTKKPVKQASKSSLLSQSSARSLSPSAKETRVSSTAPTKAPESQYHVQGLPSFTSPFQKDHEKKSGTLSPGGTPLSDKKNVDHDPISSGNAASKAARSPRMDRLAPPKLDVRSATPDGRRSSYGFGQNLDLTRTLSASQTYNSAINGSGFRPRESTRLSSMAMPKPYFNVPDDDTNEADLSLTRIRSETAPKRVTIHDFTRLRGLLASVAVKATNISAYCEEIPNPQSSFFYSAFESTKTRDPDMQKHLPVARRQEHSIAARHLIAHLNTQSSQFNDHLNDFTTNVTVGLQREIQILEDNTESSLFPRLQKLSDEAGELAQKLTTTSTLAVRTVNDEVVEAARMKRRGPFRISRGFWFKLMEWGVVGLLWGIWAVVTIIRVFLGITRGFWAMLAWLLWLR